jgi:dihydroorotase
MIPPAAASAFLNLGMTIDRLIERLTITPARSLGRPGLGTLSEGADADVALFELEEGEFGFVDSDRRRLVGDRRLRCVMTIRRGEIVWDSEGLSAPDWIKAGPYSNFK